MQNDIITSWIDGAEAEAGNAFLIPVIDPVTGQTSSQLAEADAEQVNAAVEAARRAFPAWAAMGTDARNAILYAVHDILVEHADELAQLEARTTGLPLSSVLYHIGRTAANFRNFAEIASNLAGETYSQNADYLTYVTREPKGVAALVAPWNAPLTLGSMRIATCIAFGNSCVVKPSEYTPASIIRMVELMEQAGLPKGVVNIVNGRGHITGEALIAHKGIDMVGFTGGSETGRAIMSAASRNLKPAILELGGKSATLITEDADLEQALDGALLGIFSNNGQQCLSGSRIILHRSIADEFIAAFVERAKRIKIGDPMDAETEMGPLAFAAHRDRVLSYVDIAVNEGCKLLTGGGIPAGMEEGCFIEPIAVLAPSNKTRVCQEEIFGPFATFLIYDTLDEAIEIANDSEFGLVAYVWTSDLATAMRCSKTIKAGTIWINTPMMRELRAPFGGYKTSGIGRDGAVSSADFFTELKTTSIPVGALSLNKLGAA